jgi:hypothetical protein
MCVHQVCLVPQIVLIIFLHLSSPSVVVMFLLCSMSFAQTSAKCVGFGAVYRISFALTVFFMIFALLQLARSCASVDNGWWLLKFIMYIGNYMTSSHHHIISLS